MMICKIPLLPENRELVAAKLQGHHFDKLVDSEIGELWLFRIAAQAGTSGGQVDRNKLTKGSRDKK